MIALLGTIVASSLLFLIFRLFPRFQIDTTQAIVFNYFTAFTTGIAFSGLSPDVNSLIQSGLIPWLLLCGFLFISLFITMGFSSQKNGMGVTSVAVKMSLALSGISFMFIHHEPVNILKIVGLLLAITGIILITHQKGHSSEKKNSGMILYLFVGSAGLDIVLNAIKVNFSAGYPDALFTAFGFLFAGFMGVIWLIIRKIRWGEKIAFRNLLAGIALGIPNYFSIYFLVKAYESPYWNNSTVLAIMNISIVSLAAVLGIIIFKESVTLKKLGGLGLAILAILLMTIEL